MFGLFNDSSKMPPSYIPKKNQAEWMYVPGSMPQGGPVIGGSGPMPPGGPGPVIGGPGPMPPGGPGPVISGGNQNQGTLQQKIRPCIRKFSYLWLDNGSEFWFYVQAVTPRYVIGWRMRNGNVERGRIALSRIEAFYCHKRD